jgi:mono/diheme cytochrome c family protein
MHFSKLRGAALASLLAVTAITFLHAQAPQSESKPPAPRPRRRSFLISRDVPDSESVDRGQKVFVARCGFCHGANAKGGEAGPDLIRSVLALDDEGGDKIGPVILHGRPEKGMPAIPLKEDQIKDIAAFLRSRQQAAINRGDYKILNVVTGDPKKGEAYFNGEGRCNSCHSTTGDLAGIATKYEPFALQSRFLYPRTRRFPGQMAAKTNPRSQTTVTVIETSGNKVSGDLEYIDDFEVRLQDEKGEHRSFARENGLRVEVHDPLAKHEELLKRYSDADMHNLLAYLVTLK